jgi:hypothetical protein
VRWHTGHGSNGLQAGVRSNALRINGDADGPMTTFKTTLVDPRLANVRGSDSNVSIEEVNPPPPTDGCR